MKQRIGTFKVENLEDIKEGLAKSNRIQCHWKTLILFKVQCFMLLLEALFI